MPKKRYTPEEIIQHLRTVELEISKGVAVLDACGKLRITEHVLPLEERIRWAARGSSEAAEGTGAGESAPQADCRRPSARSVHLERGGLGKLLSPARRRKAVAHTVTALQVSDHQACRAIGQIRSSYRYALRPDHKRARLRERIIALAKEYGRYGYVL